MGQLEIYEFLQKQPKRWFTSKEIQEELGLANQSSTTMNLKKLRSSNAIDFKRKKFQGAGMASYLYRAKKEED